uniref:Uncharacterized protein n=1 Tax=Panagrellus redivivus TaxID=6233 RepID=A0A7E4V732_PANRE
MTKTFLIYRDHHRVAAAHERTQPLMAAGRNRPPFKGATDIASRLHLPPPRKRRGADDAPAHRKTLRLFRTKNTCTENVGAKSTVVVTMASEPPSTPRHDDDCHVLYGWYFLHDTHKRKSHRQPS